MSHLKVLSLHFFTYRLKQNVFWKYIGIQLCEYKFKGQRTRARVCLSLSGVELKFMCVCIDLFFSLHKDSGYNTSRPPTSQIQEEKAWAVDLVQARHSLHTSNRSLTSMTHKLTYGQTGHELFYSSPLAVVVSSIGMSVTKKHFYCIFPCNY